MCIVLVHVFVQLYVKAFARLENGGEILRTTTPLTLQRGILSLVLLYRISSSSGVFGLGVLYSHFFVHGKESLHRMARIVF